MVQPLSRWHVRTLEILGLAHLPRVEINRFQACEMETAIYSTALAHKGWMRASSLRASIRDAFLRSVPWREVQAPSKIYASRSDTKKRQLLNESELERRLIERGYTVVNCGSLEVEEQVALFANADMIVAPHGAALTNVLFASPSATVYELLQASYAAITSASMSRIAGCSHCIDFFPDDGQAFLTKGWHCDVDAVLKQIEVLEKRAPWIGMRSHAPSAAQR